MEIIFKKIDDLTAYENNARTHPPKQIDLLTKAIKKFGFRVPVEITEDNVILSGHARILAARKAGLTEVPTLLVGLDEVSRRGYILAANKIALLADWDKEILKEELTFLNEADFDLGLTGFSDEELLECISDIDLLTEDEINAETETPENTVTQLGDVWLLNDHRLMCGDSTDKRCVDKLYNTLAPVLMVTDPPYGVNYEPEWREERDRGLRATGKVLNDNNFDWTQAFSLFDGNAAYVWHAVKFTGEVAENLKTAGFDIISQIIWAKQHFVLSRGDYHWQHEPCWYVVKSGKNHNWKGKRNQSTLWEISNAGYGGDKKEKDQKTNHSTQKPLECMSRPIENNSSINDYVYDPFGGSGTTLIACEKLKRKCLMMELSPIYCDMIISRFIKLTNKNVVLEKTGESFAEVRNSRQKL